MSRLREFLNSSIGRKIVMGMTGLLMIGFLIAHMSANLLVITSKEAYNHYSEMLIKNPLIYVAEAALIAFFASHVVSGFLVHRRNRAARPVPYAIKANAHHTSRKSLASSTMIVSGIVMLLFVPLHIRTFKFGPYYDWVGHEGARDLHKLVIEVFHKPGYVAWYVLALVVLGGHAWHGFGSAFESLGVSHRSWLGGFGRALAVVLTAGFALVPLYVYFFGGGA